MTDQLTDREAEMMGLRGWLRMGDNWYHPQADRRDLCYERPAGTETAAEIWWREDLAEVRDELRERSPYAQGFWDAEHGALLRRQYEQVSHQLEYERGRSDYWSAVSDMNADVYDANDEYIPTDEEFEDNRDNYPFCAGDV